MSFVDWTEPARLLEADLLPVTEGQLALASFVGVRLDDDLPRGVAAAILEEAVRPHVAGASTKASTAEVAPTERQMAFLNEIAHSEIWTRTPLNKHTASAWIGHFLGERTARRLRELKLARGDRVTKATTGVNEATGELHGWRQEYEVSSIGANGLVYFRGGNGQCGWPSSLTRSTS